MEPQPRQACFFLVALRSMRNFPNQGSNLCPLQCKCGLLTTGPPGKFWVGGGPAQQNLFKT